MITLALAQNLTQDKLWNGVVDELRKDNLLEMMVFDNNAVYNNGSTLNYSYNKIKTRSVAASRAINSDYTASEADTELLTVSLKILGGKYSIDRVIQAYVHGVQYADQEAFQLEEKIKVIKREFARQFIAGNKSTKATDFDGLDVLISSAMKCDANIDLSTPELITSNYTKLLDALRDMEAEFDGDPTAYLCSREGYALIQKIADRATGFTVTKNEFGRETIRYNGSAFVRIGDMNGTAYCPIPIDESGKTAIYPVRIGLDAVHAIAPTGNTAGISVYPIEKTSSDAVRSGACEMVTAIAVKNARTAGKISFKIKATS